MSLRITYQYSINLISTTMRWAEYPNANLAIIERNIVSFLKELAPIPKAERNALYRMQEFECLPKFYRDRIWPKGQKRGRDDN